MFPAETATAPLDKPGTETGVELEVLLSSPRWPFELLPQHWTPPELKSAHVWSLPAATAATLLENPETETGVELEVVKPTPFPSWP